MTIYRFIRFFKLLPGILSLLVALVCVIYGPLEQAVTAAVAGILLLLWGWFSKSPDESTPDR